MPTALLDWKNTAKSSKRNKQQKRYTQYIPVLQLEYGDLFSFRILGEPTTLNTLLLLEEFEDRPETRESNNSKNDR